MLPSDPVTSTLVAFAAITDRVEDTPAETVVGLAEMLIEAFSCVLLRVMVPPQPTTKSTDAQTQLLNESTRPRLPNRCATDKVFLPPAVLQERTSAGPPLRSSRIFYCLKIEMKSRTRVPEAAPARARHSHAYFNLDS